MTGNSVADEWIWRVQWHGGTGYGIGYGATSGPIGEITTRLYSTTDGVNYAPLADPMCAVEQFANEVGITFLPDGRAVALVRRDWKAVASVGVSSGDYSTWTFQSSNYQVGGPQLLTLPDGRIVAGSRLYLSDDLHSALSWLDPATGALDPFLIFPSHPEGRSDTGYLGLYYHENEIWATYYVTGDAPIGASSDIYLARVSMPVPEPSTIALAGVAAVAAVGFRLARRVCRRGGR
jgi:hypothetical protein